MDNDFAETSNIKSWLEKDMRVPWTLSHCVNVEETRKRIRQADLIILKPETEDFTSPKDVFNDIEDMVFEVPILVLTSQGDEHGLSTYVMEQGAADTLIRGQFARLVDAIEFSLIRQKLRTDARKKADTNLTDAKANEGDDIKNPLKNNLAEDERHRQILRMFSGDYSVDPQHKDNN
jgi:hypothetical protein